MESIYVDAETDNKVIGKRNSVNIDTKLYQGEMKTNELLHINFLSSNFTKKQN